MFLRSADRVSAWVCRHGGALTGSTASSEAALPNDAHKGVLLPSIYQAFTKYRAESNGRLEHVEKLLETAGKSLVEQGKKLEELQETTELLRQMNSSR